MGNMKTGTYTLVFDIVYYIAGFDFSFEEKLISRPFITFKSRLRESQGIAKAIMPVQGNAGSEVWIRGKGLSRDVKPIVRFGDTDAHILEILPDMITVIVPCLPETELVNVKVYKGEAFIDNNQLFYLYKK